jgi:hypothetical protein
MFAYSPTENNRAGSILGAGQASAAATQAQAMGNMGQNIGKALESVGSAYAKYNEAKKKASAFDTVMGAAEQEGLVTRETLDMFRNVPWQQKAEAFDLYKSTIFPIGATQQKADAQANAWAQYRGGGGGGGSVPGGQPNKSNFTF